MTSITRIITLGDGSEFACQEAAIVGTHIGIEPNFDRFQIEIWCEFAAGTRSFIPVSSYVDTGQIKLMKEIKAILSIVGVRFWEDIKYPQILVLFDKDTGPFSEIVGIASIDGARVYIPRTSVPIREAQLA